MLARPEEAGLEADLTGPMEGGRLTLIKGDTSDLALVNRLAREADAMVHFGARSDRDTSVLRLPSLVQSEVDGTLLLLEAARQYRHQRFLYVGSYAVYGEVPEGCKREGDALAPQSVAGASQAAAEHLVRAYHMSLGLPTVVTRGSDTYGPYQLSDETVPLFITNALQGLSLPIEGEGVAIRDYLYVDDHAAAIAMALMHGPPGSVYNVGSGCEASVLEIAERVLQLCDRPGFLKHFVEGERAAGSRRAISTRAIRSLGWVPQHSLDDGVELAVNWYAQHQEWWYERRPDRLATLFANR